MKAALTGSYKDKAGAKTFWKSELEQEPKQIVSAPQHWVRTGLGTLIRSDPGQSLIDKRAISESATLVLGMPGGSGGHDKLVAARHVQLVCLRVWKGMVWLSFSQEFSSLTFFSLSFMISVPVMNMFVYSINFYFPFISPIIFLCVTCVLVSFANNWLPDVRCRQVCQDWNRFILESVWGSRQVFFKPFLHFNRAKFVLPLLVDGSSFLMVVMFEIFFCFEVQVPRWVKRCVTDLSNCCCC
jgi:hypothetical protein